MPKKKSRKWGYIRLVVCDSGFEVKATDYSDDNSVSYTWAVETWAKALAKLTDLREEGLRIET